MNTRKLLNFDLAVRVLLILALSGAIITGALAQDRNKRNSDENGKNGGSVSRPVDSQQNQAKPAAIPATPFNPWGDGRYDKGIPVKGRENQPFNPWGDDRYDPKPQQKNPYLTAPGLDIIYPGSYRSLQGTQYANNGTYQRNRRNGRDGNYQDNQSYYQGDPNNTVYGYVPTGRQGNYHNSSSSIYNTNRYAYWGFNNGDPNYCRSAYYYYGNYPYVNRSRVFIAPYPNVNYFATSVTINNNNYYLVDRNRNGIDYALSDIRSAWLNGRSDLIASHVSNDLTIAVLLDGNYDYSIEANDYIQMTFDAIDNMETVEFRWDNVKQRTNGDYTAFGRHIYLDSNGRQQTVYVSYTLRMMGNNYYIVEVGSSKQPLS